MTDVLSQSEVESLLAALDSGADASPMPVAPMRPRAAGQNISVYDFKCPERVSKEQMRAFQGLHEGFARELGAGLSGMLRTIVEVKLISVDQLTFSEFVFSLENPTCFNVLHSQGVDGHIILDLNPSIVFPIIDRLLGGGRDSQSSIPARALTDIELKLVSRLTGLAIDALQNAWQNIAPLDLSVETVESNPQLVQIVPPNEVIVLISFELMMGDTRGVMNLCIPFNTIEPIAGKLSTNNWSAYTAKRLTSEQQANLEFGVSRSAVQLSVEVARTTITTTDLVNLEIGDVILTDAESAHGVTVLVENEPIFQASVGEYRRHKAIQLENRVVRTDDQIQRRLTTLSQSQPPADATPAQ